MKAIPLVSVFLISAFQAIAQQYEMVKDINPGSANSYVIYMTPLGNKAVFKATTGNANNEPWVTDGTTAGTFMLKEINPSTTGGSNMTRPVVFNNEVYFGADDGVNGSELWKTDGTPEGTRMVKDICPGSAGSKPGELTLFKDAIYFSAYHTDYGIELWKTSGTEESTVLAADMTEGAASTKPGYLFATAEYLYFTNLINLALYRSDGSTAGTGILSDAIKVGQLDEPFFTQYCGSVYFRATERLTAESKGSQLWRVSGSAVQRVTEIVSDEAELDPRFLTVSNNLLFFEGEKYPDCRELWVHDTVSARMVKDINPAGHGNLSGFMIDFKGKLIFSAGVPSTGVELWVSDGTETGTKLVKDIYAGQLTSSPQSPVIIGDTLYFSAIDSTGGDVWRLPSPDSQPEKCIDIPGIPSGANEMIRLNDSYLFMAGEAATGTELWKMTPPGSSTINNRHAPPSSLPVHSLIHPNPVNGLCRLVIPASIPLPAVVTVYNTAGSAVSTLKVTQRHWPLGRREMNHPPGLYFLLVNNGARQATGSFIISGR